MEDHRLLRHLPLARFDDRGSLPMAMLIVLVGTSMGALLVPIVGREISAARSDADRARALVAAQSGLEVVMAQFRGASNSTNAGLIEQLPGCALSGDAGAGGALDSLRYQVQIAYRNADGAAMSCPPTGVPSTANLSSTGTGAPTGATTEGAVGSRTVKATYSFSTSNNNITGGNIRLDYNSGPKLCVDVAVTPPKPAAGTWAQVQTCVPGSSQQLFAYTPDLNIKVVGSESVVNPQGMCLEAALPHYTGEHIVYQPCANRVARQQWAYDGSNWPGTSDGVQIEYWYCINTESPIAAGSHLIIGWCDKPFPPVYYADSGIGAGMAGEATNQLVNYKQFSRCVDVYGGQVQWSFHIAWPCHQAPDGNYVWNQRWFYTHPTKAVPAAVGRLRAVTNDGSGYCLKSPLTPAAGAYVVLQSCAATGALPAGLTWTVYGDTGDYTSSYRIEDENYSLNGGARYCLMATDPDVPNPDVSGGISKLKVAVCDGSPLQKWNAPANIERPTPLTDIREK